jgi:uncharacterized glyoxalase superfamily protein PhnB
MHAEVMIGDCEVMLGEPMPGMEPMPASLSYYIDGAQAVDATYGYRSVTVKDVGGNRWTICAVIEELTREQMQERMAKMMGGG